MPPPPSPPPALHRVTATTAPRVLFLAASLRKASLNVRLSRAVQLLAPSHWQVDEDRVFTSLPLYDQDLDTADAPLEVAAWRQAVSRADGLVITFPEYNHALPSLLKNAIDWASSPPGAAAMSGKVVALLVATSGAMLGRGAWTQAHTVVSALGNFVVPAPQVVVNRAQDKLAELAPTNPAGITNFDSGGDRSAQADRVWRCPISRRLTTSLLVATDHALQIGAGSAARAGLDWLAQGPKAE